LPLQSGKVPSLRGRPVRQLRAAGAHQVLHEVASVAKTDRSRRRGEIPDKHVLEQKGAPVSGKRRGVGSSARSFPN